MIGQTHHGPKRTLQLEQYRWIYRLCGVLSDITGKFWKMPLFAKDIATFLCLGDFTVEMRRVILYPESVASSY